MAVRGGWLLLVLIAGMLGYDLGRYSFPGEKRPAQTCSEPSAKRILVVDESGRLGGIHQINDASELVSAIYLAGLSPAPLFARSLLRNDAIEDGKCVLFQIDSGVVSASDCGWMTAATRMTLAIPLRVNQMTALDWDDLPGVGPSLALRIEEDRQKNGDFVDFSDLARVAGVGTHRLENWTPFFTTAKPLKNNK